MAKSGGKQPGAGKPFKKIDWDIVDDYLMKGCNGVQVAAVLGIHPDTLYARCINEKGYSFSDYTQVKRQKGNSLLHAKQFEVAKEGNTTMLVWLGKQRLGQSENPRQEDAFNGKLGELLDLLKGEKSQDESS